MSETTLAVAVAVTDLSIEVDSISDMAGDREPPYKIAINNEEMLATEDTGGEHLTVERDQAAPLDIVARDDFTHEEPAGTRWGFADDENQSRWRGATTTADVIYTVTGGKGIIELVTGPPGASPMLEMAAPLLNVQVRFALTFDVLDVLIDAYVRCGTDPNQNGYRARLLVSALGAMSLRLSKNVAGVNTAIVAAVVPPGTVVVGDEVNIALQAIASTPTSLAAKAWRTVDGEPSSWQTTSPDSEATLQTANMTAMRWRADVPAIASIGPYTVATVPEGQVHSIGDRVVLVEPWPLSLDDVVVGHGPPLSSPGTSAKYLDIDAPALYLRAGANWYIFTLTLV